MLAAAPALGAVIQQQRLGAHRRELVGEPALQRAQTPPRAQHRGRADHVDAFEDHVVLLQYAGDLAGQHLGLAIQGRHPVLRHGPRQTQGGLHQRAGQTQPLAGGHAGLQLIHLVPHAHAPAPAGDRDVLAQQLGGALAELDVVPGALGSQGRLQPMGVLGGADLQQGHQLVVRRAHENGVDALGLQEAMDEAAGEAGSDHGDVAAKRHGVL